MLKQHPWDGPILPRILAERRVLELQHVDPFQIQLPVNQPVQLFVGELADGVRDDRPRAVHATRRAHQKFSRCAEIPQLLLRRSLPGLLEQRHHVHLAKLGERAQCLIHEYAAAMHRRTDRIG